MALSIKYQIGEDWADTWDTVKDRSKPLAEWEPNDPPDWTLLWNSDLQGGEGDWILAVSKVWGTHDAPCPPEERPFDDFPRDTHHYRTAYEIAATAVRYARYVLPNGGFNQLFPLDPELNPDGAPPIYNKSDRPPRYVASAPPKALYEKVQDLWMLLIGEDHYEDAVGRPGQDPERYSFAFDPMVQLLARYYATLVVGGGVCSQMSAVTAGMATLLAHPIEYDPEGRTNTEILVCFHGGDHSFCILRYGDSPWLVADPWVAEPYVLPIQDNYFQLDGIVNHQSIVVKHRLEVPWGIPMLQAYHDLAFLDAEPSVENLALTKDHILAKEREVGARELESAERASRPPQDYLEWSEDHQRWLTRDIPGLHGSRYHTQHVWQHATNFGIQREPDENDVAFNARWEQEYASFRADFPPVARAYEWGARVTFNEGDEGDGGDEEEDVEFLVPEEGNIFD